MINKNIQVVLYTSGLQWGSGNFLCIEDVIRSLSDQGCESVYIYDPEFSVRDHWDEINPNKDGDNGRFLFLDGDCVAGNAGCLREIACESDAVFVLLALNGSFVPNLSEVVRVHEESDCDLTTFINPSVLGPLSFSMDLCVFDAALLEHVPPQGYWDVHENLIPELVVLGKKVKVESIEMPRSDGDHLIAEKNAQQTKASQECVKLGRLRAVSMQETESLERIPIKGRSFPIDILVAIIPLIIGFAWAFFPVLSDLWQVWTRSDEYSSGMLVPFLAGWVLWGRREQLRQCCIQPALVVGVMGLLLGLSMRFYGLWAMFGSLEKISLVVTLWALVLWGGGWRLFIKVLPVLLFLGLMLPWPNRIHAMIMVPLQNWATTSAVFSLELLGYSLERMGNVIQIGDTRVAVAEACNGLRMITAFFVIGGLVALLARRTWWEKLIIVLSCLPIALLCNTIRLTVTSIAFTKISGEYWETVFHDFGGYAMMPLALLLMVFELWIFDQLFVSGETTTSDVVVRSN